MSSQKLIVGVVVNTSIHENTHYALKIAMNRHGSAHNTETGNIMNLRLSSSSKRNLPERTPDKRLNERLIRAKNMTPKTHQKNTVAEFQKYEEQKQDDGGIAALDDISQDYEPSALNTSFALEGSKYKYLCDV